MALLQREMVEPLTLAAPSAAIGNREGAAGARAIALADAWLDPVSTMRPSPIPPHHGVPSTSSPVHGPWLPDRARSSLPAIETLRRRRADPPCR